MDDAAATDAEVPANLAEVLRLTAALADRILADLSAGRPVGRDQSEALQGAVSGLRRQGVALPPSLDRTIADISRRAAAVIQRADRATAGSLSWTFGRTRGHQRLILSSRTVSRRRGAGSRAGDD